MDPKELEALKADLAKQRARADLAEAELSKQTARADAAEKRIAEAEKARADAADPARVQAAVRARLELEKRAASLAPGLKLDGLVDAELKLAVIDSRDPEFSKHSRRADSVYVDARFDLLAPPAPAADVVRVDAVEPQPQDYRAEYLARISNAYKTPSGK